MQTVYQKLLFPTLLLSVLGLSLWSWVLVDPNFTLVKHADWTHFRNQMVQIGYFNRGLSSQIYLSLILITTIFSFLIVLRPSKNIVLMSIVIGVIAGLLSYPALSHDLFNYIFDAKILTVYGQNPYLHKALDFPTDPMLRFMHWTHRTYPYGPAYLLFSLIPSFLGFGKFATTFLLFKLSNVILYILTVYLLSKKSIQSATLFALSPLVMVEGLINSHNDFVALCFGVIGILLLKSARLKIFGIFGIIFGGLIKFISIPTAFLILPFGGKSFSFLGKRVLLNEILLYSSIFSTLGLLIYLVTHGEIHPWYFLNLYIFVPYFRKIYLLIYPFIVGLLMSYYPYVVGGEWGQGGNVGSKNYIIYVSIVINILMVLAYLVYQKFLTTKPSKSNTL